MNHDLSYYLGAAIDLSSDLNPFEVMTEKITAFDPRCVIFRPDSAYRNAHKTADSNASYLKGVNDYALLNADVAIFYISSKVFSMGAALEIQERAKQHEYLSESFTYSRPEKYNCNEIDRGAGSIKRTLVITDKAGLYLKVQQSEHLVIHLLDGKTLEETDIAALIESMYTNEIF